MQTGVGGGKVRRNNDVARDHLCILIEETRRGRKTCWSVRPRTVCERTDAKSARCRQRSEEQDHNQPPCSPVCLSTELQRERRRVHGPGLAVQLQPEDQAHENVLQAPPASHHEVLLCHQPQPGRKGPQAAGAEDWPHQAGPTGACATCSSSQESGCGKMCSQVPRSLLRDYRVDF